MLPIINAYGSLGIKYLGSNAVKSLVGTIGIVFLLTPLMKISKENLASIAFKYLGAAALEGAAYFELL